jgi:hypothetical protein
MIRLFLIFGALIVFLVKLAVSFPAFASNIPTVLRGQGTIRDVDAPEDGVLFRIAYEHSTAMGKPVSTKIKQFDLNNSLLVEELSTFDVDGRFKSYSMVQHQTGERVSVFAESKNVVMSFTKDGKTSISKDTLSDNANAPGSVMAYLSGSVEKVKQGLKIPIRLAVAERGMMLNFEIQPLPAGCRKNEGDLCVNLAAGNFFLKGLVKPVYMAFQNSKDGYLPLTIETPAIVRRQSGKSLKKFTARIEYPQVR